MTSESYKNWLLGNDINNEPKIIIINDPAGEYGDYVLFERCGVQMYFMAGRNEAFSREGIKKMGEIVATFDSFEELINDSS